MDYRLLWGTFNKYTYIDLYFSTKSASQPGTHSTQTQAQTRRNSIVGTAATSCYTFHQSPAHRIGQIPQQFQWSCLPFFNQKLLQLLQTARIARKHSSDHIRPEIFNWIEIRRVSWPDLSIDLGHTT